MPKRKDQYINGAKSAKPYAALISNPKYWTDYSKNNSTKARSKEDVEKLIPNLNNELKARANQPSLVLYKSQPTDREGLGGHFGDYDHAKKYYGGNANQQQKMLKFTLKPGAHELLFDPKYMALGPAGKQHRPLAELTMLNGRGKYPLGDKGEGYLGGYIGLKAEGTDGFSLGFKQGNKASELLFNQFVEKVEEGHPGEHGFEPIQQNSPKDLHRQL